jgi:ATP synthase protein I
MFRLVLLQMLTSAVVALGAGLLGGPHAAISALLGGAACWIPNGLFALRLTAASGRPQGSSVAMFFFGEFIKVASTLMLLAAVVWLYKDLVWLAMLVSFIAVLKSYLLALFIK